jgi:hypothetical protein
VPSRLAGFEITQTLRGRSTPGHSRGFPSSSGWRVHLKGGSSDGWQLDNVTRLFRGDRKPRRRLFFGHDLIIAGFNHFHRVTHFVGNKRVILCLSNPATAVAMPETIVNPFNFNSPRQLSCLTLGIEIRADGTSEIFTDLDRTGQPGLNK